MAAKFNKLFKLLIDKNMKKGELIKQSGVSNTTIAKLGRGDNVNVDMLIKICQAPDCTMDDIMEIPPRNNMTTSPAYDNQNENTSSKITV